MIADLLGNLQDEWRLQAACDGTNPSIWFNPEHQNECLKICDTCPVKTECLEDAMANHSSDGIAGGLLPMERYRLAHQRRIVGWNRPLPTYEERPELPDFCVVTGCEARRDVTDMCRAHYDSSRRKGTTDVAPKPTLSEQDAVWTVRRVAAAHGVLEGEVMSSSMVHVVVAARHEVMVELVAKGWSLKGTGRFLGKHHTSVLSAVRKVAA